MTIIEPLRFLGDRVVKKAWVALSEDIRSPPVGMFGKRRVNTFGRGHNFDLGSPVRLPHNIKSFYTQKSIHFFLKSKAGSAREIVETCILGCFPKYDEFGLGDRHALGLEQQIV